MMDFTAAREEMVRRQIAGRGLTDDALLDAMRAVPRELFVPADQAAFAYQDRPLPIEAGQAISQPAMVAEMIAAAGIKRGHKVLEIGAGSGYAAAVMGRIAAEVIGIERHAELVRLASARLDQLGYTNVRILHGDGSAGLAEEAPFDAILIAASGRHVPEPLKRQLAIGGALVMPIGAVDGPQDLIKVTRTGENAFTSEDLGAVRFVPLIGAEGWPE